MLFNTWVRSDQENCKKEESAFTSGVGVLISMGVGTASTQTSVESFDGNFKNTATDIFISGYRNYSSKNPRINFLTHASNIKNHVGVAFMTGILAQYVSKRGFTGGLRWVYGRIRSSSTVEYPQENLFISDRWVRPYIVSMSFTSNGSQSFFLKDSYFNAVLFE